MTDPASEQPAAQPVQPPVPPAPPTAPTEAYAAPPAPPTAPYTQAILPQPGFTQPTQPSQFAPQGQYGQPGQYAPGQYAQPGQPGGYDPNFSAASFANGGGVSGKSFVTTWILSWLLGGLGIDRFYLGKVGTGILKLITFGGFGVWWLIDLILVLTGAQRDKQGLKLAGYDQNKKIAWIVTAVVIVISSVISAVNAANGAATSVSGAVSEAGQAAVEDAADPAAPAAEEPAVPASGAPAWADKKFGAFEPIVQSGAGDNLITLPVGVKAGLVTASHDGTSNFSISVLNASNESTGDLLVNTIGAYSGTTVYGFSSFSEGTTLQVTADGNWSITISPVSAAPALAASGAGDAVFLYDGPAGKLGATHDGSSNFQIVEETDKAFSMGLLVNEIGAYSGTVPLSKGPSVVSVRSDGNWTLTVG
ncbi:NINE protein [Plantibacter sp. YIM 135249]|uniref:TM2 domain-containing protein n=1 Tax=Plantibacter sp. YIM 135249 TaxID=3423918 RepID=UPI003D333DCA